MPYNDLDAMDKAIGDDTAAVILESIPATAGFPMPEPGYLAGVADLCRERGALYIADEVQTGLGRTGTVWYVDQETSSPTCWSPARACRAASIRSRRRS